MLGESNAGKTKFLRQICLPKYVSFSQNLHSIFLSYSTKIFDYPELEKPFKFEIWDTASQERYRSMTKMYYKNTDVIIFVYSITDHRSFEEIKNYWYESVKNTSEKMPILAVVANKGHKYEYEEVSYEEGKSFAHEIGAIFQESSKLSNFGINNLIKNIGKTYLIPGFNYKIGC